MILKNVGLPWLGKSRDNMALQIQISFLTNKLEIYELGKLGRGTVQPKSDHDDAAEIGGIYVEFHDLLTFSVLLKTL